VYAPEFLDHFQNPRHRGSLADATHRGASEDPVCGDRLWLDLRVAGAVIQAARFRVEGCPGSIAAGSALVTLLLGRPASAGAVTAAEVEGLLGEIPRAKRHALRLVLGALADALRGGAGRAGGAGGAGE
jgi:NifU-like protein involved in Fe-S cluster formation